MVCHMIEFLFDRDHMSKKRLEEPQWKRIALFAVTILQYDRVLQR